MVLDMTVDDAIAFFSENKQNKLAKKLNALQQVGLGYVTLGQSSATLSGGEAQRIKLASFIGKGEQRDKILFIFDEPTTGLHFHDIKKLLTSFDALLEKGHSLLVVEHNMDLIKCADHVIDLGPEGGDKGGTLDRRRYTRRNCKNQDFLYRSILEGKAKRLVISCLTFWHNTC